MTECRSHSRPADMYKGHLIRLGPAVDHPGRRLSNGPTAASVCHPAGQCASAWSTTACSRTRSGALSAGIEPGRAPGRAGHEVTYLTLRQWERGDAPRHRPADSRRRRRPAHAHYIQRAAGGASSLHSCSAPACGGICSVTVAATTSCTWRRFRTSRCSPPAPLPPLRAFRAGRGLARGLEPRLLARVPRHDRRRDRPRRTARGARLPQRAFCFSRLYAARLREEGLRGELTVLRGEYGGSLEAIAPEPAEPVVVFAGRLIREKRALLGLAGVAAARDQITGLRGEFYGDGPERGALLSAISERGLDGVITARASSKPTGSGPRSAGRCACCCPPAARATRSSSSRPPPAACRASWWPTR